MIPVNSKAIRAVAYDGDTLFVLFTSSEHIYPHPGVPYAVFVGLMRAESKGAFYMQHIRGRYR
jgi:hypothetical protein